LQTKLHVNKPGDTHEREADRIADQIQADSRPAGVRAAVPCVQRFSGETGAPTEASPAGVDQVLTRAGRPLEPVIRRDMEKRFHYDFSRVRIHSDEDAARSTEKVNAQAYTVGHHVVFGEGRFRPDTRTGRWLIAHELTHVAQQSGAEKLQSHQDSVKTRPSCEADSLADTDSRCRPPVVRATKVRLARKEELHSDEELGVARHSFYKHNDHLTENQRWTIANAVVKAAYTAKTYEIAYQFFDYYSGWFGGKIRLMTKDEEDKARKADRYAETDPGGDTRIRPDILEFSSARLGAILLHELSHTGHIPDVAGYGSSQEGHSYGIEYFYAEKAGDADRMYKIIKTIGAASVTMPGFKKTLQDLFKVTYTVMTALRELHLKGSSAKLPVLDPPLTSDDGELLLSEYVTHFAKPGERLQKIIVHVSKNLSVYYTGPDL
jgi:hypothetical protein